MFFFYLVTNARYLLLKNRSCVSRLYFTRKEKKKHVSLLFLLKRKVLFTRTSTCSPRFVLSGGYVGTDSNITAPSTYTLFLRRPHVEKRFFFFTHSSIFLFLDVLAQVRSIYLFFFRALIGIQKNVLRVQRFFLDVVYDGHSFLLERTKTKKQLKKKQRFLFFSHVLQVVTRTGVKKKYSWLRRFMYLYLRKCRSNMIRRAIIPSFLLCFSRLQETIQTFSTGIDTLSKLSMTEQLRVRKEKQNKVQQQFLQQFAPVRDYFVKRELKQIRARYIPNYKLRLPDFPKKKHTLFGRKKKTHVLSTLAGSRRIHVFLLFLLRIKKYMLRKKKKERSFFFSLVRRLRKKTLLPVVARTKKNILYVAWFDYLYKIRIFFFSFFFFFKQLNMFRTKGNKIFSWLVYNYLVLYAQLKRHLEVRLFFSGTASSSSFFASFSFGILSGSSLLEAYSKKKFTFFPFYIKDRKAVIPTRREKKKSPFSLLLTFKRLNEFTYRLPTLSNLRTILGMLFFFFPYIVRYFFIFLRLPVAFRYSFFFFTHTLHIFPLFCRVFFFSRVRTLYKKRMVRGQLEKNVCIRTTLVDPFILKKQVQLRTLKKQRLFFFFKRILFFCLTIYTSFFFISFYLQIEKKLRFFLQLPICLFIFSLRRKYGYWTSAATKEKIISYYYPPMQSAKFVCEYLRFFLERGRKVTKVFLFLRKWQLFEAYVRAANIHVSHVERFLLTYKYPMIGLRVQVSGSFKKGQQKRTLAYHLWVRNNMLTRAMPLQCIDCRIDFYKSSVFLVVASLGIKVWLAFPSTRLLSFSAKKNNA